MNRIRGISSNTRISTNQIVDIPNNQIGFFIKRLIHSEKEISKQKLQKINPEPPKQKSILDRLRSTNKNSFTEWFKILFSLEAKVSNTDETNHSSHNISLECGNLFINEWLTIRSFWLEFYCGG